MSDGWTNQKQQPIMNFLVYCPKGAMFLKSIDTSGLTKDAETLFNMFDSVVQDNAYIVQLITDNASAYKKVGNKITAEVWYFILVSLCSSLHRLDVGEYC